MYRSKDKDFMNAVKQTVLQVTRGVDNEDRKYAVNYLKTHVQITDLHEYAKKKFPNRTISFGTGSYNPKLVILTKDPITPEQVKKLQAAWRKLQVEPTDIYYAHLRFIKTKQKQDIRKDIVEKLLKMLNANIVVIFDDVDVEVTGECYRTGQPISFLSDPDKKEERKALTMQLRQYRKQKLI